MSIRNMLEKTEQYTVEIINGRQRTCYDRLFRIFLYALSHLYRFAVQFRIMLYTNSLLKRQTVGSSVVSVGNLTVGGTGKTPVVELLARTLAMKGRKVAILSRGYRSKPLPFLVRMRNFLLGRHYRLPPKVVSNGIEVSYNSHESGDEPYMLARNLLSRDGSLGVSVVVDKDRVHGGRYAIRNLHADTLLLDDGFQYMPLNPRINIVLVDTTNPFHNHEMLPIGLLREPIENIVRANYIFLTKSRGQESLRHLVDFLHRQNPLARVIECNHEPRYLQDLWEEERKELSYLNGKKVGSICGIAVPKSFEDYITKLGAEIVYKECYVDHHRYSEEEIESFCKKSVEAGADLFVTTEKDAVRIPKVNTYGRPFDFLRVEINILSGQENFAECIRQICMGG